MKRDYLSVADLTREEIELVFRLSLEMKEELKRGRGKREDLSGRLFALIFEKPSLRTRVTFEGGIKQMGGDTIYLAPQDIQLGKREAVKDVARNLNRWVDGVVARVFSHDSLVEMAENMDVPVVNALSDLEHPCQALADYLTIFEKAGRVDVNLVFVGDGNNVANSLMFLTAILGGNFTIACPEGYEPTAQIIERAKEIAEKTGASIEVVRSPQEAVKKADFIYTDVWASMGQEAEAEVRNRIFRPYQVNSELLSHAPSHALVMHCLPARRGLEITDEVLDGERSIVLDQAENRLHAQKGLLKFIYQ